MSDEPAAAPPPPQQPSATNSPYSAAPGFEVEEIEFPLQSGEQVLAVIRRHPFFLWPRTLLWLGFALGGPILLYWILSLTTIQDEVSTVFWIITAIWVVFWGVRLFLNWYQYQYDIWIITNQRILDSRKATPINHKLATADLINLQDITVHRRGVFASILGFGDVSCETATARDAFVLSGVSRPVEVQSLIDRERDRERMRRA
jgi:hypothetical protein